MFISNRAFNLINEIEYHPKFRWFYESLFRVRNPKNEIIRFKGVLNDEIIPRELGGEVLAFLNYFKKIDNKHKSKFIEELILNLIFLIFFFYLKRINSKK